MKKLIVIILALIALSTTAKAQYASGRIEAKPTISTQEDLKLWKKDHYGLIEQQSQLLKQRKTALIIATSSLGCEIVGAACYSSSNTLGAAMMTIGGIGLMTGGIWMIVNEFQMIETNRKINESMSIRLTSTGVALQF